MTIYKKWAKNTLNNHKLKGCEIKITPKELVIIAINISTCQICNIKLNWIDKEKPNGASLDRIDNELLIEYNNIQIICKQCNNQKGNLTMEQFIKINNENNMEIYKQTLMDKINKNIENMLNKQ